MRRLRCGVSEPNYTVSLHAEKWKKTNLKWYFVLNRQNAKEVTQKYFAIWQNVSNLKFEYSASNLDIIISFSVGLRVHLHNSRFMKGSSMYMYIKNDTTPYNKDI